MILKIIAKILLSKEEMSFGMGLSTTGIRGINVTERGGIMVDGKIIASSAEFKELQRVSSLIISNINKK